jgi:PadR family transcriptional regulator, regulatory protein PadR
MLILKTLALEPMHGWGVAQRIEQISGGVFKVNAGSLFSAFSRLERAGSVKTEWMTSENNRRAKYYSLTAAGRKALAQETREWERQISAIAKILEA